MFRNSLRISSLPVRNYLKRGGWLRSSRRFQSSQTPRGISKGGRVIITFGTMALGIVGGTVAYAGFDSSFRKWVQGTVPFSEGFLSTILGPEEDQVKRQYQEYAIERNKDLEKKRETHLISTEDAESPILKKKIQRDVMKIEELKTPVNVAHKVEEPDLRAGLIEEPPACEPPPKSKRTCAEEELEELERELKRLQHTIEANLEEVMGSYTNALNIAKEHVNTVMDALEKLTVEGTECLDRNIGDSTINKNSAVKIAEKKNEEVRQLIEELRKKIHDGYGNKDTSSCPLLAEANNFILKTLESMDTSRSQLANISMEAEFTDKYHGTMKRWYEDLQREVAMINPEFKVGKGGDMSQLEFNLLLKHAHQKLCQLMESLAKLESQSFQHQNPDGIDVSHMVSQERLNGELDRQKRDLEADNLRKLIGLRDEAECQLRHQLRHQAAAHADHLQDALRVQGMELERRWTGLLEDEVRAERLNYHQNLAALIARARGLDTAIRDRSELDQAWRRSQSLWAACAALLYKLKASHKDSCGWEEKLKCIRREVLDLVEVAGPSNQFVQTVVKAIPCVATERGIYPEDALKERFIKVEKMCRQVALVGENGGGLTRYLLSYIQSILVVNNFENLPMREFKDLPVLMENFSTFDILNRAKFCLDKDDLPQAVRYLGLLKGGPRVVVHDWLCEARVHLEVRLAAEALVAHAAAVGVQASV